MTREQADAYAKVEAARAELDEVLNDLNTLKGEATRLGKKWDKARTTYLQLRYPDGFTMTPEAFNELCVAAWNNTFAHHAIEKWYAGFGICRAGTGGMVERPSQPGDDMARYRAPRVAFTKSEDVAPAVDDLRAIAAIVDEATLYVDVFEHTLSENGSYHVDFTPATDTAVLSRLRYGTEQDVTSGTLSEVLSYVNKNHWYQSSDPADNDIGGW